MSKTFKSFQEKEKKKRPQPKKTKRGNSKYVLTDDSLEMDENEKYFLKD